MKKPKIKHLKTEDLLPQVTPLCLKQMNNLSSQNDLLKQKLCYVVKRC